MAIGLKWALSLSRTHFWAVAVSRNQAQASKKLFASVYIEQFFGDFGRNIFWTKIHRNGELATFCKRDMEVQLL